jgi:hypothetical protein
MDTTERATHRVGIVARLRHTRASGHPVGTLSPDFLEVACAHRTVPVEAALELPDVMLLVVEDACARIAEQAWQARRPPRWNVGATRRWRAETAPLHRKQERVRALAEQYLDGPLTPA